ncbi:hypothetical protein IX51_11510 [uncultured archaeon]|nr:hypothetical protein IX51_11510 [uncultured archaeon]HKJ96642.1 helix-turn-helix domain-containing protein [Thermoplasmataceae archaeon]
MVKDDLDLFLTALENSTRREILKRLTLEESYALEISKWIGVSQQAINKQLDLLEKSRLISSAGLMPSNSGAPRKIYRPTNFSSIIIDYSRSFFEVKKYELDFDLEENRENESSTVKELIGELKDVNEKLDDIMKKRTELLSRKDSIIMNINSRIAREASDNLLRAIISTFLETLDEEETADRLSMPPEVVKIVVSDFLKL